MAFWLRKKLFDATTVERMGVGRTTRMVAENVQTEQPVKFQTVYVQGVQLQPTIMDSGTISFAGAKRAAVAFAEPFQRVPRVLLTMLDSSTTNPYATTVSKTGFTVNFQNAWTGSIEWTALLRS